MGAQLTGRPFDSHSTGKSQAVPLRIHRRTRSYGYVGWLVVIAMVWGIIIFAWLSNRPKHVAMSAARRDHPAVGEPRSCVVVKHYGKPTGS